MTTRPPEAHIIDNEITLRIDYPCRGHATIDIYQAPACNEDHWTMPAQCVSIVNLSGIKALRDALNNVIEKCEAT